MRKSSRTSWARERFEKEPFASSLSGVHSGPCSIMIENLCARQCAAVDRHLIERTRQERRKVAGSQANRSLAWLRLDFERTVECALLRSGTAAKSAVPVNRDARSGIALVTRIEAGNHMHPLARFQRVLKISSRA